MKPNLHHTGRSSTFSARLQLGIAVTALLLFLPTTLAQSVPDRLNYQGILLDGQGAPVTAITDVEFRIWDTPTATDLGGLKWGRMFKITPDTNGTFNVVLSGEGPVLWDAPDTSLASVFTGTGSDSRYLELTVAGSTAIRPRQRFVASPYAFLAHNVTDARQDFTVAGLLTVTGAANVESLTSSGEANVGSLMTAGEVTAASFNGNGAGLTNINTTNLVQQVVEALCPPGTIVAFGGATIPSGWLLCDGQSFLRADYPRLFSAISTNWGSTNSTHFNLPDLRAMFLRGVNGIRDDMYKDPDAADRVASPDNGNVGNQVGSLQTNSVASHVHKVEPPINAGSDANEGYITVGANAPQLLIPFDTNPYGGNETRPNNAYVNYIIKY